MLLATIHHVQVAVPTGGDDESRAFYTGVLGMTEHPKPPVLAALGGCWFRSSDEPGAVEIHTGVEEPFTPARKAHPGIYVHDIDALADIVAAHGHRVDWDESIAERKRFHTSDPHGNRLEFIQKP